MAQYNKMPIGPNKIALVTNSMSCGGVETFILRLGKFLRLNGHDVTVVTTVNEGEWFGQIAKAQLKGVNVGKEIRGLFSPIVHSVCVGRWLASQNYDIIFLNNACYAQASISMLSDRVLVIPIVHNDSDYVYKIGCSNRKAWNVLVAVSPKTFATSQKIAPRRPVVYIPNGVCVPPIDKCENRRKHGFPIKLIFIGRIEHAQKGVLILPDILKGVLENGINALLQIVGVGPDIDKLKQRIQLHGLQDKIIFHGLADPERITDFLVDSHILLMPSFYEGLPLTPIEAQSCGCVPVVSLLPGITDLLIEDGQTGMLAEKGEPSGFVRSVSDLSHNPALWEKISKKGREEACNKHSVDVMGNLYLRLIEEALRGNFSLPYSRKFQIPVNINSFDWQGRIVAGVKKLFWAIEPAR